MTEKCSDTRSFYNRHIVVDDLDTLIMIGTCEDCGLEREFRYELVETED